MCNCGKKRNDLKAQISSNTNNNLKTSVLQNEAARNFSFEYHGRTALSVRGNISGKNYRFNYPGDIQMIDYRDAPPMTAIPVLKKLNR